MNLKLFDDLLCQGTALIFNGLLLITLFDRNKLFSDRKVDFIFPFILRNNSKLYVLILELIIINLENKVPFVIYRPDTQIKTDDIVLMVLNKLFKLFQTR